MDQENSWLLMILELDKLFVFMEGIFIYTTVINILENFMKNWDSLKVHHNNMKMINGQLKLILNGLLKRML